MDRALTYVHTVLSGQGSYLRTYCTRWTGLLLTYILSVVLALEVGLLDRCAVDGILSGQVSCMGKASDCLV